MDAGDLAASGWRAGVERAAAVGCGRCRGGWRRVAAAGEAEQVADRGQGGRGGGGRAEAEVEALVGVGGVVEEGQQKVRHDGSGGEQQHACRCPNCRRPCRQSLFALRDPTITGRYQDIDKVTFPGRDDPGK
ncbi:hypothetical protein Phou_087340 [Phytohabitans houttuyneae]|uniref:Uncharacterized protein n=1 Tax=Phytohabitans houttuyneae TaxID=1076126 RepID=A0A6V8KL16_9ACTN|nr:hypothetical protein Phou_087340 [Phytohabitans houttuyneae]